MEINLVITSEMNKDIVTFNTVANQGSNFTKEHEATYKKLVLEEMKEYQEAIDAGDELAALKELCDLHYVSYFSMMLNNKDQMAQAAFYLANVKAKTYEDGVYAKAFNEVHRSNMSKFVNVSDFSAKKLVEFAKSEVARITEEGRYTEIVWDVVEVSGESYLTLKDGNGKVLKPSTFSKAELGGIL